jgi:cytochrome c nitrite reductase small subunit
MGVLLRIRGSARAVLTAAWLPARWRIPCFAACGVLAGLGLVTAHVSRAASYLSDAPETCMNCHVMTPQYVTWQHSSHREAAVCNDCHVPHDGFVRQYAFKAQDGLRHARVFTLRQEPQVIRLSAGAAPVVEANCRRCHGDLLAHLPREESRKAGPRCWDCHRDVPHSRGRSLSATPRIMAPQLPMLPQGGEPLIGGRPRK